MDSSMLWRPSVDHHHHADNHDGHDEGHGNLVVPNDRDYDGNHDADRY